MGQCCLKCFSMRGDSKVSSHISSAAPHKPSSFASKIFAYSLLATSPLYQAGIIAASSYLLFITLPSIAVKISLLARFHLHRSISLTLPPRLLSVARARKGTSRLTKAALVTPGFLDVQIFSTLSMSLLLASLDYSPRKKKEHHVCGFDGPPRHSPRR